MRANGAGGWQEPRTSRDKTAVVQHFLRAVFYHGDLVRTVYDGGPTLFNVPEYIVLVTPLGIPFSYIFSGVLVGDDLLEPGQLRQGRFRLGGGGSGRPPGPGLGADGAQRREEGGPASFRKWPVECIADIGYGTR